MPSYPDRGHVGIDFYRWHLGTRAMHETGGAAWDVWWPIVLDALTNTLTTQGCAAGSWDPVGAADPIGGRVAATAFNLLTVSVERRYPRARSR